LATRLKICRRKSCGFDPHPERLGIEEHQFHAIRFSESTVFKIPETAMAEILTVSGLKDPEDEFESVVEDEGLEGILFEKVWSGSR
jgi:hypothetical protein